MYLVVQSVTDFGRKVQDIAYHEFPIEGLWDYTKVQVTQTPQPITQVQKAILQLTNKSTDRILTYPANLHYSIREKL